VGLGPGDLQGLRDCECAYLFVLQSYFRQPAVHVLLPRIRCAHPNGGPSNVRCCIPASPLTVCLSREVLYTGDPRSWIQYAQTALLGIPQGAFVVIWIAGGALIDDHLPKNSRTIVCALFMLPTISGGLGFLLGPDDANVGLLICL